MKTWYKIAKKITFSAIVVLILLILILLGMVFFEQNREWMITLNLPAIQPPSWVFVVVWTILYILIAISVIMVLNAPAKLKKSRNIAITLFVINAFFNVLYTIIFFGLRNVLLAFIELPFLLASILLMAWCTYKINKIAAYLLIPYFLWVLYATILTGIILFIN